MNFNLDLCATYEADIYAAVHRVIANKRYILSNEGIQFEKEWADYHNLPFAVGVGSGTDALRIALLALGVRPGDEVISPAFNVAYTAQAVTAIGAHNVFVDVDPDTMLMDLNQVEGAIASKTRVLLPVHLFGQMVDMAKVTEIARRRGLLVVEDAAQAHGSDFNGVKPGQLSDVACYSHYPTKNLGALGEAGSIVTRFPFVAERARLLRDAGRTTRYIHAIPGINSGLDEIHAAVLRAKLPHLDESNGWRRNRAHQYRNELHGVMDVQFQSEVSNHVYHLLVASLSDRAGLMHHLGMQDIPTLSHYPCTVPHQPFLISQQLDSVDFPVADELAHTVVSFPLYPDMPAEDVTKVTTAIREYYS